MDTLFYFVNEFFLLREKKLQQRLFVSHTRYLLRKCVSQLKICNLVTKSNASRALSCRYMGFTEATVKVG